VIESLEIGGAPQGDGDEKTNKKKRGSREDEEERG